RPSPTLPLLITHPPPPDTHPLSLHDALPILALTAAHSFCLKMGWFARKRGRTGVRRRLVQRPACITSWLLRSAVLNFLPADGGEDRKSTRLNSSHVAISYAVFCLKKKRKKKI